MSSVRACAPALGEEEERLLAYYATLSAAEKGVLMSDAPPLELVASDKEGKYIDEICAAPHWNKSTVPPSETLAPLPAPRSERRSKIARQESVTIRVAVARQAADEKARLATVADLAADRVVVHSDGDGNLKEVIFFKKNDKCMILTTDYPSRSSSWEAAFPGCEDPSPFQLGRNIAVYLDKNQAWEKQFLDEN